MANVIQMPLLSDTMEEGVLGEVFVKVGDKIEAGTLLAEVETDKATMEVEAYDEHEGTLLYIMNQGDSVPVGGIMAITGAEGEDITTLLAQEAGASETTSGNGSEAVVEKESPVETKPTAGTAVETGRPAVNEDGRIKASPLAKKMASDNNLDLAAINGSGDDGRVIKRDIEAALQSGGQPAAAPDQTPATAPIAPVVPLAAGKVEEVRVSQMRKTIAKRLAESKFTAPHFYLTMEINMDKTIEVRKYLNEISPVKISFNDLVLKAAALALRKHKEVNSFWMGDTIQVNNDIHVGMAVAVPEGLVVPVVFHADRLSLSELAARSKELAGKARDKALELDEMQGSTFSISNLGMFGIEEFTAIINPPNSAILAIGSIKQEGRVVDGMLKPVSVMKVTMSCDHRVVDGAVGSQFLNTFRDLMEDPQRMLI